MRHLLLSLLTGLSLSFPVMANQASTTEKPTFEQYVQGLKIESIEKGINPTLVNQAFNNVKYLQRAVTADKNQPEKRLLLDDYLNRAVPDWKVNKGKTLYKEHYADLQRISKQFGVQPNFLVALWGVESNYGAFTGKFNVIEALTTLAYDGRREAFFRKEVFAALSILEQGHISLSQMKGSWAGAMGQCQFMPSSFLSFAADGNNDGKKDIWNSLPDVFASSANYLKQAGWDNSHSWGNQVTLPANFSADSVGLEDEKGKTLAQWQKLGVTVADSAPLPASSTMAWVISPDDGLGRSYLVYGNYKSLMAWNRSHYFALAVSRLADKIANG